MEVLMDDFEKIKKKNKKPWQYIYRKNKIKKNAKQSRVQSKQKNELIQREFPVG